jgi:predicted amidohydrolase
MTDFNPSMTCIGSDRGNGNLLGMQPFMRNSDYASAEAFQSRVEACLVEAEKEGFLNSKTVVVFPEHFGTWLVAANETRSVYSDPMAAAMQKVALRHPVRFIYHLLTSTEKTRTRAALFKTKARVMADLFHRVFSHLAMRYRVTIVPGSVVLPQPRVENGILKIRRGSLYNVSMVYHPDGALDPRLVKKIFLVTEERGFCSCGTTSDRPVYDTPAGRMGVLICADSWFPESLAALRRLSPDFVVVPAYTERSTMSDVWQGYDPSCACPADVNPQDVGQLSLSDAWERYALPGRLAESGARAGMVAFLRGDFWGLGSDGTGFIVADGQAHVSEATGDIALMNLWL